MSKLSQQYINREQQVSAHNYHPLPVVIKSGKGVWVEDVEGKRYLDMLSAYSALNQGHCHPKIIAAAKAQLDSLTLTSRAFHNNQMVGFLEKITHLSGFDKGLLMNSGAEAVETAIKAMRRWGALSKGIANEQSNIIVMADNFHGRTSTIISFSTDESSRKNYGPFASGFKIIPYGDAVALEKAIDNNTIGVLLEPIQGEAGVIIPPDNYLQQCREICSTKNVLLTIDEIQTGLGRTGKFFCYEHSNIKPDIVIIGKALGGGVYPVSGILADNEVMNVAFEPGSHGSTFGGNPLACAIASAAVDVLIEEDLITNSAQLGEYFKKQLENSQSKKVKEVRGKGLMLAIELTEEAGAARNYTLKLLEKGLLAKDTHGHTIRLAPPLIITKKQIDWAVKLIEEVITDRN